MTGPFSAELPALMQAAARAVDAGDDAAAEPLLQRIVALNARDAEAWHMLAAIAVRSGRAAEAVDLAKRALELDRRNADYLNTLGVAHAEVHDFESALNCFKRASKERPSSADAHYNLGKVYRKLGRTAEAEACYVRARKLEPAKAEAAANLATLRIQQGRYEEAESLLAEARARLPHDEALANHAAICALARSGAQAALREFAAFLESHPLAPSVHAELGRLLLAEGRFAEGWREYAWRHGRAPLELPDCAGKRVLLLPDQGLGDQLFFLRFAAALGSRAARVAFACPEKLFALLEAMCPVNELRRTSDDRSGFDLSLPVGELPRLLAAYDTPAPLAVPRTPDRVRQWRARLAVLGPPPYLGVTWRAGTRTGEVSEFAARGEDPLYKEIDIAALAWAMRVWPGTVLVLQRLPQPTEVATFAKTLGRTAHDLSATNDDLLDMAALLHLIDEYVGVSNTNMHLRAGAGRTARVLVPFPPEFRWMNGGEESPWFRGFRIYREPPGRDWQPVMNALRDELRQQFPG